MKTVALIYLFNYEYSDSRLGSARLGSARLGSARLGSARLGSARLGSARQLLPSHYRLNKGSIIRSYVRTFVGELKDPFIIKKGMLRKKKKQKQKLKQKQLKQQKQKPTYINR